MARYVAIKNGSFHENFINIYRAQTHAIENFEAKLINSALYDKNGNKKYEVDIFKENGYDLKPLKHFTDQYGILENDIAKVHIEDGELVITLNNGAQKRIKC